MGKIKNIRIALAVAVLIGATIIPVIRGQTSYAANLSLRSLTLQKGVADEGSKPGGSVNHFFQFTIPGGGNVGSIQFLYCETAGGTCDTPDGLDTTDATLTGQTGATGFLMDTDDVNGSPYITRAPASVTAQAATYTLSGITNPTTTNTTFYVRIATFISEDTTGGSTDLGVVAASTATQIVLSGTMPESLIFCSGATVEETEGIPDCATASPGTITFNQLFSPADTATAESQMAASTNAGTGYVITVNGLTLFSGGNSITAMGARAASAHGVSQFGMNLKLNTVATSTVPVGAEVDPASGAGGGIYKGQATTNYGTVDEFKFTTGDNIADSAFGGAGGTDSQIFTISYIVNVPGSQPAGTYTTTLTYICTPTF